MIETIHELTIRSGAWQETTVLVGKLNRALRGWATTSKSAQSPKRIGRSTTTQPCGCAGGCATSTRSGDAGAGLIHSRTSTGLPNRTPDRARVQPAVGKGVTSVREPDAGNLHVRFDERDVKTEPWLSQSGTAKRKGRQQICSAYSHRATSQLHQIAKKLQPFHQVRLAADSGSSDPNGRTASEVLVGGQQITAY